MSRHIIPLLIATSATLLFAQAPSPSPRLESAEIGQFLADTEVDLRPPSPERIMLLSHELEARGLTRAARDLRSKLPLRPLALDLLRMGDAAAVLEVLPAWKAEKPADPEPLLVEALAYAQQGSIELALRSLDAVRPSESDQPLYRLVREILVFRQKHNSPPTAESNPWNVPFASAQSPFAPGPLPAAERQKLPPDLARSFMRLLKLEPLQGWMWGMLGEVLNAEGQWTGARAALDRARALGYTPRWVIEHGRILAEAQQKKSGSVDAAINSAGPATAGTADEKSSAWWEALGPRPRVVMVLVVGGLFALAIVILQVRQWTTRRP